MFKFILVFILFSRLSYAVTPAVYGVSSIIPGLGQTLYGNIAEGITWFGSTLFLLSSHDKVLRNNGWDLLQYNIYDAWKDAGGRPSQQNYWFQEYLQNFNVKNLADPFSVGFIGAAGYSRYNSEKKNNTKKSGVPKSPLASIEMFTFVGFGEEALFRGFLFPSLSSWLSPWGGAAVSSALFSVAHIGAGAGANLARFVMGMLFCWQYARNDYTLGPNIFAHSWYDQILIGSFNDFPTKNNSYKDQPISIRITIPIP